MTPPAVRPLVVPFASARNREGTAACTLHRVDYMEVVKEAKYCNPWKLWTRQNAVLGRDPYPWTSFRPCVTFTIIASM